MLGSCTTAIDQGISGYSREDGSRIRRFHATTEENAPSTKVYADENMKVLWNADDRISIFNFSTYNFQYAFTGDDGDTAGDFEDVTPSGFHTGTEVDYITAVYPYSKSNKMNNEGGLTMELPSEQSYKAHSFGIGANAMIAVTEGDFLAFKNVGGYISLRLYGDQVAVSRITIKGNNGEKIAGKASISMPLNGVPAVTMDATATDEISVVCDPVVILGATEEEYTDFWFVIPPVTFEQGFTITVTDAQGGEFTKSTTRRFPVSRNTLEWMNPLEVVPAYTNLDVNEYLTFESEGTTEVSLIFSNYASKPLLYYSYDREKWTKWDYGKLSFTNERPLYLCGNNPEGFSTMDLYDGSQDFTNGAGDVYELACLSFYARGSHFLTTGDRFSISGSIMALLDYEEEMTSIPNDGCFYALVAYCTSLVAGPELPALYLTDGCYAQMFFGCTNLADTPALPATTLAKYCYGDMFYDCTSLTTAPDMPETLADFCCAGMFSGCTNLSQAPALPATTLASACYRNMFEDCINLSTAPTLPATTLANSCYWGMFRGCTNLETAPDLPAPTLAVCCYDRMFLNCTGLVESPALLPARELEYGCYWGMFNGCTSLETVPELPATSLKEECYGGMFSDCTSLTRTPEFPAITLANYCYSGMFSGCTSLVDASDLPAKVLAYDSYANMFSNCNSLRSAPKIEATTFAHGSCYEMFKGCTSLMEVPDLAATTMAEVCCMNMFEGCEKMESAPLLPANKLEKQSYHGMFAGCTNLRSVECLATDISEEGCVYNWLDGVSSTGTFVKAAAMNDWPVGGSGIPIGWTVQDAN